MQQVSLASSSLVDPLVQYILPSLPVASLAALASTCTSLRTVLADLDGLWRSAASALLPSSHPSLATSSRVAVQHALNCYLSAERNIRAGKLPRQTCITAQHCNLRCKSVLFSPDGQKLLVQREPSREQSPELVPSRACGQYCLSVYNAFTGEQVQHRDWCHETMVGLVGLELQWSADSIHVVIMDRHTGVVSRWDSCSNQCTVTCRLGPALGLLANWQLSLSNNGTFAVAFCDGRTFMTELAAYIFDATTGKMTMTMSHAQLLGIRPLAPLIDPSNTRVAVASGVYQLDSGAHLLSYSVENIQGWCWSKLGNLLAVYGDSSSDITSVDLIDVGRQMSERQFPLFSNHHPSVFSSECDAYLYRGRIYDVSGGAPISIPIMKVCRGEIGRWSPDGMFIFCVLDDPGDGQIAIFDRKSGAMQLTFSIGRQNCMSSRSMAFNPQGYILACPEYRHDNIFLLQFASDIAGQIA